jgi:hypothetical protein
MDAIHQAYLKEKFGNRVSFDRIERTLSMIDYLRGRRKAHNEV